MDIALAVFNIGKAGGLELHCVRLAKSLMERGHSVVIYTTASGAVAEDVAVRIIDKRGRANHARMAAFADDLHDVTKGKHDVVVGCQKLPGPNILFCADWCQAARNLPAWKRLLPRYRTLMRLERACCGPESRMYLLMLSEPQAQAYQRAWSIAPERMTVLAPTLDSRLVREAISSEERIRYRQSQGLPVDKIVWLWIGMQPIVKGLDRVVEALARSEEAVLIAAGADPDTKPMRALVDRARRLGCADRFRPVGPVLRDDLADFLLASDLLVHPSRLDVTGTVIVEALGTGLPVITTENCGYSVHVRNAQAGVVLREAPKPREIAEAAAVSRETRLWWAENARNYVRSTDLTGGIEMACIAIEQQCSPRLEGRRAQS